MGLCASKAAVPVTEPAVSPGSNKRPVGIDRQASGLGKTAAVHDSASAANAGSPRSTPPFLERRKLSHDNITANLVTPSLDEKPSKPATKHNSSAISSTASPPTTASTAISPHHSIPTFDFFRSLYYVYQLLPKSVEKNSFIQNLKEDWRRIDLELKGYTYVNDSDTMAAKRDEMSPSAPAASLKLTGNPEIDPNVKSPRRPSLHQNPEAIIALAKAMPQTHTSRDDDTLSNSDSSVLSEFVKPSGSVPGGMHVRRKSFRSRVVLLEDDNTVLTFWDHVNGMLRQTGHTTIRRLNPFDPVAIETLCIRSPSTNNLLPNSADPKLSSSNSQPTLGYYDPTDATYSLRHMKPLEPLPAAPHWFLRGLAGEFDTESALELVRVNLDNDMDQDTFLASLSRQWLVLDRERFGTVTYARLRVFIWCSYAMGWSPTRSPEELEAELSENDSRHKELPKDVQSEIDAIMTATGGKDYFTFQEFADMLLRDAAAPEATAEFDQPTAVFEEIVSPRRNSVSSTNNALHKSHSSPAVSLAAAQLLHHHQPHQQQGPPGASPMAASLTELSMEERNLDEEDELEQDDDLDAEESDGELVSSWRDGGGSEHMVAGASYSQEDFEVDDRQQLAEHGQAQAQAQTGFIPAQVSKSISRAAAIAVAPTASHAHPPRSDSLSEPSLTSDLVNSFGSPVHSDASRGAGGSAVVATPQSNNLSVDISRLNFPFAGDSTLSPQLQPLVVPAELASMQSGVGAGDSSLFAAATELQARQQQQQDEAPARTSSNTSHPNSSDSHPHAATHEQVDVVSIADSPPLSTASLSLYRPDAAVTATSPPLQPVDSGSGSGSWLPVVSVPVDANESTGQMFSSPPPSVAAEAIVASVSETKSLPQLTIPTDESTTSLPIALSSPVLQQSLSILVDTPTAAANSSTTKVVATAQAGPTLSSSSSSTDLAHSNNKSSSARPPAIVTSNDAATTVAVSQSHLEARPRRGSMGTHTPTAADHTPSDSAALYTPISSRSTNAGAAHTSLSSARNGQAVKSPVPQGSPGNVTSPQRRSGQVPRQSSQESTTNTSSSSRRSLITSQESSHNFSNMLRTAANPQQESREKNFNLKLKVPPNQTFASMTPNKSSQAVARLQRQRQAGKRTPQPQADSTSTQQQHRTPVSSRTAVSHSPSPDRRLSTVKDLRNNFDFQWSIHYVRSVLVAARTAVLGVPAGQTLPFGQLFASQFSLLQVSALPGFAALQTDLNHCLACTPLSAIHCLAEFDIAGYIEKLTLQYAPLAMHDSNNLARSSSNDSTASSALHQSVKGMVTKSELARFLWLSDMDSPAASLQPTPEPLPADIQEAVAAILTSCGGKDYFTFWDFANMLLVDQPFQLVPHSPELRNVDNVSSAARSSASYSPSSRVPATTTFALDQSVASIAKQLERLRSAHESDALGQTISRLDIPALMDRIRSQWSMIDSANQGAVTRSSVVLFVWEVFAGSDNNSNTEVPPSSLPAQLQEQVDFLMLGAAGKEVLTFGDFATTLLAAEGLDMRL